MSRLCVLGPAARLLASPGPRPAPGHSHPEWARCSSGSAERRGCDSPFHSRAVHPARRSSGSRSPPGSGCRRSAPGARSSPWPSPPDEGRGDVVRDRPRPPGTLPPAPCPALPLITWPAIGFLQAPQTPLATVATPSLFRSDCRLPSMLSS